MLSWLPLIGPIIDGLVSAYNKSKDTSVAILKTNREADVEEAKVSADIIKTTEDDILLRIIRDLMILPGAVWFFLGGWDTIVAENWPNLRFLVSKFPPQLEYYPYAVLVFLLGNIGINTWRRK